MGLLSCSPRPFLHPTLLHLSLSFFVCGIPVGLEEKILSSSEVPGYCRALWEDFEQATAVLEDPSLQGRDVLSEPDWEATPTLVT